MQKKLKGEEKMEKIEDFMKLYGSLASFMNDFCMLKDENQLSQKEIAHKAGTTQSAISRIETLNTNPSYKVLSKLSEAVGGDLYITPMGEMTITVPYGMQGKIRAIADSKQISVKTLLLDMIKNEISENFCSSLKLNMQIKSDIQEANYTDISESNSIVSKPIIKDSEMLNNHKYKFSFSVDNNKFYVGEYVLFISFSIKDKTEVENLLKIDEVRSLFVEKQIQKLIWSYLRGIVMDSFNRHSLKPVPLPLLA